MSGHGKRKDDADGCGRGSSGAAADEENAANHKEAPAQENKTTAHESQGAGSASPEPERAEITPGNLSEESWRNFHASGRRVDSSIDVMEDGTPLTKRWRSLDHTSEHRDNAIRREIRFASCGCPILRTQDFFRCASGDLVCKTTPGHAVRCATCGLIFSWKAMTLIDGKRHCPGCRRWARLRQMGTSVGRGICAFLRWFGQ